VSFVMFVVSFGSQASMEAMEALLPLQPVAVLDLPYRQSIYLQNGILLVNIG
jgi:hypothetical protein